MSSEFTCSALCAILFGSILEFYTNNSTIYGRYTEKCIKVNCEREFRMKKKLNGDPSRDCFVHNWTLGEEEKSHKARLVTEIFLGKIWRAEVLLCQNTKCRITQIQKYKLQKYKIQERGRFTLHAACTSVLWENLIYWAGEEESESNCKGIAAGPRVESSSTHSRPCWSPSDLCIVQARTLSSGAFRKHVEYRFRCMWREQQRFPG